jgi:hypothetical protein
MFDLHGLKQFLVITLSSDGSSCHLTAHHAKEAGLPASWEYSLSGFKPAVFEIQGVL